MTNLSAALCEGTKQAHSLTANTAYMKCLMQGVVKRSIFRQLLGNLYFIYGTLEDTLSTYREHPILGKIYFPELSRTHKLAADLEFYYGRSWEDRIKPTRSALGYVMHLQELANHNPTLLVAHAYTRYLGDLSGGQAIKNRVRMALDLPEDAGTAMYDFDCLPTPGDRHQFKAIYRNALDALPLEDAAIEQIVAEANYAFALNRDVMQDLEAAIKAAIGSQEFEELTHQSHLRHTELRLDQTQKFALSAPE